ncbi:hypothetical protein NDU88_000272 [Pleurodeles waltl]|uniref:Uncharacterized protein n=1 Tax=Pleurodeles waltl TaxID=8319 RepID=A0AAV7P7U0_PLEWA|nr:hypothetical protein NDU88_000272 [Pleurodeles waltl]
MRACVQGQKNSRYSDRKTRSSLGAEPRRRTPAPTTQDVFEAARAVPGVRARVSDCFRLHCACVRFRAQLCVYFRVEQSCGSALPPLRAGGH